MPLNRIARSPVCGEVPSLISLFSSQKKPAHHTSGPPTAFIISTNPFSYPQVTPEEFAGEWPDIFHFTGDRYYVNRDFPNRCSQIQKVTNMLSC